MIDAATLKSELCRSFCRDLSVSRVGEAVSIGMPTVLRDGDHVVVYVQEVAGGWRVSDMGTTLMRLSYENDMSRLLAGARLKLFSAILAESGLAESEGEIFLEAPADRLTSALFSLSQGVARVEDLGIWTRSRVESTFMDDLRLIVLKAAGKNAVTEDFAPPGVPNAQNYTVDFCIQTAGRPLYLFGVANKDRARLATITLQHLAPVASTFDSMVVCSDMGSLPTADLERLMTAANDIAPKLDAEVISSKIRHRMAA